MRVFTVSEAQEGLADLLEQVQRDGAVRIRANNGKSFLVTPDQVDASPLDVEGIDLDITRAEIIEFVHEGRRGSSG
jgi:hypothetical protein